MADARDDRLRAPSRAFVGRDWELSELVEGLDDVAAGRGRVFLVHGDAGIGKTRLVEELTDTASERGMRVAWARCWEGPGAPAFWPWAEIIRTLHGDDPAPKLDGVGALVPLEGASEGAVPESEAGRFRLFEATISYLTECASRHPAILVFDDLQWADTASLDLLDFFAGRLRDVPIMCIGTYRETEPSSSPERTAALATLGRLGHSIPLRGLSKAELQAFVRDRFAVDPPRSVVSDLWALTEGNPFFADEVVRLFLAESRDDSWATDLSVPEGVKEVILRRLRPLPDETRRLLRLASVLGRTFTASALARAGDMTVEDALLALARTDQLGVLEPLANQRFEFVHALIREALHEELEPEERAAFHLSVAGALEDLHSHDLDDHRAEIGHHLAEAGGLAPPGRAVSFLRRAGDAAIESRFYEEAARCYTKAASVIEADAIDDPADLASLLLDLGQAHRRGGAPKEGIDTFRRAAVWARRAERADLLVRAAVGFEDARFRAGNFEMIPEAFLLLQEAGDSIGQDDDVLRAEVLSRRPRITQFVGGSEEMIPPAQEALAIAERVGDPHLLMRALEGLRWAYWDPYHAEERLALSERLIAIARAEGDDETRMMGDLWRYVDLFALGRADDMDEQMVRIEGAFEMTRQPWFSWWPSALAASRALMRGSIDEAEEHAGVLRQTARENGDQMAYALSALTFGAIGWEASSPEFGRPVFESVIDLVPLPSYRAASRAFLEVILDRRGEAERAFEEAAARGFEDLPLGAMWLPMVTILASTCAYLDDAERAEKLYELMAPIPRLVVLVPPATGMSTTPHWRGVLAATAGRAEDAAGHFEDAIAFHTELRAWAWLARSHLEYGRMLMGIGGRPTEGREQARRASELASSLGLRYIADRAGELLGRVGLAGGDAAMRLEGDTWQISYQGLDVRLSDIKGLPYLDMLLKSPGEEFHVLRMLSEPATGATVTRAADAREAGLAAEREAGIEVLDDEAKRTYRDRLTSLREEVAEAEAMGDAARASKAREEVDWLAAELSKALGLGGRDRRSGSAAERARVNVQRAIRTALRRIADAHPDLGEHLSVSVRTGTFCCYTGGVRWTD